MTPTVFSRQEHDARDPRTLAEHPPADTVERIGDLLRFDEAALLHQSGSKP